MSSLCVNESSFFHVSQFVAFMALLVFVAYTIKSRQSDLPFMWKSIIKPVLFLKRYIQV